MGRGGAGRRAKAGGGGGGTATATPEADRGEVPGGRGVEVIRQTVDGQDPAALARRLFGRDLSDRELAALTGASPGSRVYVSVQDGALKLFARGGDYQADRTLGREGGKLVLHNDYFRVNTTGSGLGASIFASQVESAARLGVDRIETLAARGPNFNGYYTWARLGYDAGLSSSFQARLPASLSGARRISDLMKTETGRDYWKTHGTSRKMTFDLKTGSHSRRTLDAYRKERAKR